MKDSQIISVLKSARELISDEKNWTQGDYALDDKGEIAGATSNAAVCFCAVGAIIRVAPDGIARRNADNELSFTCKERFGQCAVGVNDNYDHPTVLSMFDKTIERLEA